MPSYVPKKIIWSESKEKRMVFLHLPGSASPWPVEAVSFDLWETLIQLKDGKESRIRFLAECLGRAKQPRELEAFMKAYQAGQSRFHLDWYEKQRYFGAEQRVRLMLKELDAHLSEDDIRSCTLHFQRAILEDPPPPMEGAPELLDWLSSRVPLVLVSDSGLTPGTVLREILELHGLLSHFSATVFSDETGFTKPDPRMFQEALRRLEVSPSRVIHVGDNPKTDVAGALKANLGAVWLDGTGQGECEEGRPLLRVERLPELLASLSDDV